MITLETTGIGVPQGLFANQVPPVPLELTPKQAERWWVMNVHPVPDRDCPVRLSGALIQANNTCHNGQR